MEGDREGMQVETPKGPIGQAPVERQGDRGSLGHSQGHESGMYGNCKVASKGGGGRGRWKRGKRAGPALGCFSPLSFLHLSFVLNHPFLCFFSSVRRAMGRRRKGSPTRTDYVFVCFNLLLKFHRLYLSLLHIQQGLNPVVTTTREWKETRWLTSGPKWRPKTSRK